MPRRRKVVHSRKARGGELDDDSVIFVRNQLQEIVVSDNDTSNTALVQQTTLVPWAGGKRDKLSMVYVSGDDPWEFCLAYETDDAQRQSINETIEKRYREGLLERCSPKVGEFVVCHQLIQDRHEYFRGLVTKYNPKLRHGIRSVIVYKLDYGDKAPLFPDDVYCVPEDLAVIPSRVVKCRLLDGEHELKERFCAELRLAFKEALEHSTLTVDLGSPTDSQPPCFSAVVWGFVENRCIADVNLNHWIESRVMPRLKEIPPECADVFVYLRELEIMDPFYEQETVDETVSVADLAAPGSEVQGGEDHHCLPWNGVRPANDPTLSKPESAPIAIPKFVPECYVQVTNYGSEEDNYDGVFANLQDEYQPTDERRICWFYQKNGWCGRKLCAKEHVEKSALWTTDTVLTFCSPFNDICLPGEGSEVLLKVQHLRSPVSFYVTLPDAYSDIGEPGALETSATLHADLNSMQSNSTHPLMTVGPQISELVIALGHQESLGPRRKWLRARVTQVLDDTRVEVFFLDFGNKAVVRTKDLRAMRPQFLHLPPQAVLTRLHNLKPKPGKREVALRFLNSSIVQKELKAEVVSQYDGEIDVLLYTAKGECFNDILVRQNLADVINRG